MSFLVWDEFKADKPTWYGCLQPVFQQYANLYPIMDRFVDLSSYDSISQPENLVPLTIVFRLDASDPNAMPVTRDLSASKRKAILYWLEHLQDGKPALGAQPPAAAARAAARPATPASDAAPGGKLAALHRRLAARSRPQRS